MCNNRGSCTCECGWTGDDCNQLAWCHEKFTLAWILLIVCVVLLLTVVILVYLWCVLYNGRKWSSPCQKSKNKSTSLVVTNQKRESNKYAEYNYNQNVQVKTGSYKDKGKIVSDSTKLSTNKIPSFGWSTNRAASLTAFYFKFSW